MSGIRSVLLSCSVAVLLLSPALFATPAQAAQAGSRTITGTYEPGSAEKVQLDIPFGDVRVEGVDGGPVRARVEATCDGDRHCAEFLKGLRLESDVRGRTLRVKLECPKSHAAWNLGHDRDGSDGRDSGLRVTVQIPRSLALDLNVGAGEVNIEGLRDDVSIDMGAGEVTVRMAERVVQSVDVNLGVGETVIHQGGRTQEYARVLGGPVRWSAGKGDAGIEVNLGAGEVEVTLE